MFTPPSRVNAPPDASPRVPLSPPYPLPLPPTLRTLLDQPSNPHKMVGPPKRTSFKKASTAAPKRASTASTSAAPAAKRAKHESDDDEDDDGKSDAPVVPEVCVDEEGGVYMPVSRVE